MSDKEMILYILEEVVANHMSFENDNEDMYGDSGITWKDCKRIVNKMRREQAKKDKCSTYIDSDWQTRWVKNDKYVHSQFAKEWNEIKERLEKGNKK